MQLQMQMQAAAHVAAHSAMMYAARAEQAAYVDHIAQADPAAHSQSPVLPVSCRRLSDPALAKLSGGYSPCFLPDQAALELQASPSKPVVISFEAMRVRRMAAAFVSMLLLGSGIVFLASVDTSAEA